MNSSVIACSIARAVAKSTWWQFARSEISESDSISMINLISDFIVRHLSGDDIEFPITLPTSLYIVGDHIDLNSFFCYPFDEIMKQSVSRLAQHPRDADLMDECVVCVAAKLKYCEDNDKYFDCESFNHLMELDVMVFRELLLNSLRVKNQECMGYQSS